MDEIQEIIDRMGPEAALNRLGVVLRGLFSQVNEELRLNFVVNLIGEAGADKVASLVHL
ncbi:MAG: hypothetical protein KJ900_12235 [Proteobacteria bacterium]|nr:hypothetical protein [Pseudomonadota bacterium]MBU4028483.1 hypothetical protein [Pseudomonadota bacterium]MBU4043645.1 hypothetical protein [Pseudomonadota bacterium]MBU4166902.1 hypothetical protein [Pseudomonadota bacterium]MCG2744524.1 hypothetical protein [Desulfobacteraceae bacterium]